MYDFWDYCNAVRRNVLATTLFIAVVRVNETKFLSNLTLSSFSAGLDFGWGGDVCKRGGWKCMCGCWRFLVVRLCCKPGFRGGPGGNRRVGGGGPPPLKGGPRHNRPKLLHLHRSPPNTCYARGNSGSSPLPFETRALQVPCGSETYGYSGKNMGKQQIECLPWKLQQI